MCKQNLLKLKNRLHKGKQHARQVDCHAMEQDTQLDLSYSLSLMNESLYFIFKISTRVILSCATVSTTFMRSILPVQSLVWARQQRAGREEMNPQLPVKVNSALLNGMQQYVLITRLFKASLITWCLCCPPHPTHPPPPRPSLSRSGTTLPLLLSETRLSPKAPRVSGRELGWVGSLRMQIRVRNRAATVRNWMRRLKARNDLASGPPRSPQHPVRSGRGSWLVRLCRPLSNNSTRLISAFAALLREPMAPIDHVLHFHIYEKERTS